ncbi:HPr family phosphocarrier protein [Endozoicomonas sp. G2_2]|uniref:HPr family phosphocarrier protein n=1 Tax=Gammaproteobacteria TaxID=1236 RepID=UPI000C48995C|nr:MULTISPECIES: HPr family phosphocarrier protein [Gammaproteobacteria]MAS10547.1 phosphocarrier protein HPr [Salinisphaera sp.]MBO9470441.1 HPr family phosphocarrier protein [Endozoicomonas sp. G2_2]|tara:strand:- start:1297 stop:1566 length:270 start_codon:yes stop_codon:yes gene_type:complete
MPTREFAIVNKLGLHARAASKFVTVASQYEADIRVAKDGREVSGKSIMGVMMLAAARGSRIDVSAEGADAEAALDALEELVRDRFGEGQ